MRPVSLALVSCMLASAACSPPTSPTSPTPSSADSPPLVSSASAAPLGSSAAPSGSSGATSVASSTPPPSTGPRKFKGKMALAEHNKEGKYWIDVYETDVKCGESPKLPHTTTSGPWAESKTVDKKLNFVSYSTKDVPQNNSETTKVTFGKLPTETTPTTFQYTAFSIEVAYDDPAVKWDVEAATVPVTLCKR